MGLQISIRESADVTILDLRGKLTIGVDSDLLSVRLKKLVTKGVRKLLLNLEDVTQLDSSGISAVVGTYVSVSRQGGSRKLLCPCGRVQEVLWVVRQCAFGLRPKLSDFPAEEVRRGQGSVRHLTGKRQV